MALTRKLLKALGIEDEKVEEIISAHTETVDGLKEQRDAYKADADKLSALQRQPDAAEENGKDAWKVKYDALKEDFETYKTDVAAKETKAAKAAAYRALLKSAV